MHTVEMLESAIDLAQSLGYRIRHEWLGGTGGGACEFGGRKYLFVDLALSVADQLEQVASVLRDEPAIHVIALPAAMRRLLDIRQVA